METKRIGKGLAIAVLLVSTGWAKAPAPRLASALETLAASMAPGTWAELATTGLNSGVLDSMSSPGHHILEYSDDGVWDPVAKRFLFMGGAHGDPWRAKFIRYTDSTNTWEEILPRETWSDAHGYDHNAVDPATGDFYHRAYGSGQVHKYSAATSTWSALPPIDPNLAYVQNCCGALEYFPEMGGLVFAIGGYGEAVFFNATTGQWRKLNGANLPMGAYHNFAEYNPVHKVVIFGGGNEDPNIPGDQSVALYKLDQTGTITRMADAPLGLGVMQTISTLDPVSGDHLFFGNGDTFYSYDVTADRWTLRGGAIPIFSPSFNPQVFGIVAAPVSTYGVTMFVKWYWNQSKAYLYKHAASAPPHSGDADGDGLPDAWENQYFGNLNQTASGDPDGDGLTNSQELSAGTNPADPASPGTNPPPAGGTGEGDEGCGATGLEAVLVVGLLLSLWRGNEVR